MITHSNLKGLNTLNKLTATQRNAAKNIEKLSSGLRINSAADDAAGLTISEKMRAQIKGLQKAQRNIQDGISLVQTAEGAMGEMHSILQRVRELSVQSANDSHVDEDRTFIQMEVNELLKEMEAITERTEYNQMTLLAGKINKDGKVAQGLSDLVGNITKNGINDVYEKDGKEYASAVIDFSNLGTADDIAQLVGEGFHYTCATCSKAYSVKFVEGNPDTSRLNDYNPVMEVDITGIANGEDLVKSILETAYGQPDFVYDPESPEDLKIPDTATEFVKHYSQLAADGAKIYLYDYRSEFAGNTFPTSDGHGTFKPIVYNDVKEDLFLPLKIQNGSNQGDHLELRIPNVSLEQLSIEDLLVTTQIEANLSIVRVDAAINKLSFARATLGTYQNRLDHSFNNVTNYDELLSSAESRIRDADIAKELMMQTKNDILTQSAQLLLAEANQRQQDLLNIIK